MKNIIIKISFISIICLVIMALSTITYAGIEMKPNSTPITQTSFNNAFYDSYNMRYSGSLGSVSVDPHLASMADWTAVTFLGMSQYGNIATFNTFDDSGMSYSNGNITGVTIKQTTDYGIATSSYSALSGDFNTSDKVVVDYQNTRYLSEGNGNFTLLSGLKDFNYADGSTFTGIPGGYFHYAWKNADAKTTSRGWTKAMSYRQFDSNDSITQSFRPAFWN